MSILPPMNEDQLVKLIKYHSFKYYEGEVQITDDGFDKLIEQLHTINPNNPILSVPGWGYCSSEGKLKHLGSSPVGSLGKTKYPEVHPLFSNCLITPKFDGLSIVLYANDGKLTALTRNDGSMGKDCTKQLLHILEKKSPRSLERLLALKGTIAIRGEVLPDPKDGVTIKDMGIVSPRNFAAGLMNRIEVADELQYLLFVPYFVRINTERKYQNQLDMLLHLMELGFYGCPYQNAMNGTNPEELTELYEGLSSEWLIDGLVISPTTDYQDHIDYSKYEKDAIAYKFQSEVVDTVVKHVDWATGSSGRINPTVVFDSVFISGANVNRASAFHASFVKEKGIGTGACIQITRANEVIPHIVSVSEPVHALLPSKCPSCDAEVEWDGYFLMCASEMCPSKAISSIYKLFEVSGIPENLGWSTMKKYLNTFPVNMDYTKIDNIITYLMLFNQLGEKNLAHRTNELQKKFNDHAGMLLWKMEMAVQNKLSEGLTYENFWYVLNLAQLGPSNAAKMKMIDPGTLESMAGRDALRKTGVSTPVLEAIKENSKYWNALYNIVKVRAPLQDVTNNIGLKVCVTGAVSMTRSKWGKLLQKYGVELVGNVGKDVKFLICNNPEEATSSKAKAAEAKGTKVITELDLYVYLKNEHGITVEGT